MHPAASLRTLDDVHGIFVDAFVQDRETGHLLFASFWSRDTALQELLARLSLPTRDGGLASLHLRGSETQFRKRGETWTAEVRRIGVRICRAPSA